MKCAPDCVEKKLNMRPHGRIIVAVLLFTLTATCHGDEKQEKQPDSVYKFVSSRQGKSHTSNYLDIIKCAGQLDIGCLLDKSQDYLLDAQRKFAVEADETAVARKSGEQRPSALMESIGAMITDITEMIFKGGLSGFFRDAKEDESEEESSEVADDDDDDDDEDEEEEAKLVAKSDASSGREMDPIEPRKKKVKKKDKIKATIKFLVLGIIVFGKITLLLKLLSAHLQVKFLIIAFIGLLINSAKFYLDLKKGHQPQKVIYYEHAQHQHHYENEEDWSSGGGGGGGGGHGSGGYWARAYDKEEEKENAAASAQELAYAHQKPSAVAGYSKVEDGAPSNPFSWFK